MVEQAPVEFDLRRHLHEFLEIDRLDEILRILSLYRLSFGQPRQQELIENLLRRDYKDADLRLIRDALLVDLAPINRVLKAAGDYSAGAA